MKLVVSGGGTGGHVYPALEVARVGVARGWDVRYFGSLRGQEGPACQQGGLLFEGFASEPVGSLKKPSGWKSLAKLLSASVAAKKRLAEAKPDFVFATGGYSAAPVLRAARSLGIPFGLHEQNAMPGRTIVLSGKRAEFVATVFRSVEPRLGGCKVVRTGMPIRRVLRDEAQKTRDIGPTNILVVGGSQGAASINEAALAAGARITRPDLTWTHVCGKANFDAVFHTFKTLALPATYEVKAFLQGPEMASAYANATLVVGRSGAGTLTELAAFRLPSVLIPYPLAFAQHQLHNAKEFEQMGAATILQDDQLGPAVLENAIGQWLDRPDRTDGVRNALRDWDVADAADRIADLIMQTAP